MRRSYLVVVGFVAVVFGACVFAADDGAEKTAEPAQAVAWPRIIKVSNADITVYQPQLEEVTKNKIKARAAVAVKRKGRGEATYCAVWMTAKLATDRENRTVSIKDIKVDQVAYPGVSEKVKKSLGGLIRKYLLKADMTISLDRLLAMMEAAEKKEEIRKSAELKNPVPQFFFSKEPAVLVSLDGKPVFMTQKNGVSLVVNTNFQMAREDKSGKLYLRAAGRWFEADKYDGDWKPVEKVPANIAAVLSKEKDESASPEGPAPKIFIATKPAELIQCSGEPVLGEILNTNLSYLKNSDNDIFRDESTSKLYVLASGRWFTADKKEGPWKYIPSDKLPEDFRRIPDSSPKAHVLASIAGTPEAKDAVMDAAIPQTATLKRGEVDLGIKYSGEPKFEKIEKTSLSYAVNTDTPVVMCGAKYYACVNGAWYESNSPNGPWNVCVKVPDEIYDIPPSNPLYNTTFVKAYDYDDDDDTVEVGYTPGYTGSFVIGGGIVYGTGWLYRRCWLYHHRPSIQPIHTYGARYRYDRYMGHWRRYARYRLASGQYQAWRSKFRQGAAVRPATPMARGEYIGRQPRTALRNAYAGNKSAVRLNQVNRGVYGAKTARARNRMAAAKVRASRLPNNVYVGKDGNIYRHTLNGWQKRGNGRWTGSAAGKRPATRPMKRPVAKRPATRPTKRPVKRPAYNKKVHSSLRRHYRSRQRGSYRTRKYRSYRRSYSTSSRRRSYSRPRRSGGFRRGGGGRRR